MSALHSEPTKKDLATSELPAASSSSARICEPMKTLLVVDDDQVLRNLEAEILRQQGYHVLLAESAAEALRVAESATSIHLLLADLSMPHVDGLEGGRRFRAAHPEIPVLMVSDLVPWFQDRVKDVDQYEFLEKPFEFDELLHKVRTLLNTTVALPRRGPAK
jgi:DNA-binding response OmpR family regulator